MRGTQEPYWLVESLFNGTPSHDASHKGLILVRLVYVQINIKMLNKDHICVSNRKIKLHDDYNTSYSR